MLPEGWRVTFRQGRLSPFSWCGHVRSCLWTSWVDTAPWGSLCFSHHQLLRAGSVQAGLSCS